MYLPWDGVRGNARQLITATDEDNLSHKYSYAKYAECDMGAESAAEDKGHGNVPSGGNTRNGCYQSP